MCVFSDTAVQAAYSYLKSNIDQYHSGMGISEIAKAHDRTNGTIAPVSDGQLSIWGC